MRAAVAAIYHHLPVVSGFEHLCGVSIVFFLEALRVWTAFSISICFAFFINHRVVSLLPYSPFIYTG
jgi:hypothetical protein